MDKEMKRLCYMGILKEGFSAYSSPVMLISRKLTKDKMVVTDFRHLNVRIAKNNLAYPLVRDTFSTLGSSKCEVLSVLDLKDAFHSLWLLENSKKYCGILPFFGSPSYLYQRMPMGLNISPSIWQSYINAILSCLQSKKYCEAIMDDLILFTPSKESHMNKLEDILNALLKNGLKVSPKKCQLFRTNLQYMGNEIFIENKKVCVKPLRNRLEAIQKLQPPKTPKGCRSFAGVVNFITGTQDMKTEINLDIEENSPFQEGVILELIQRPDKSFFQNPRKLEDVINPDKLVHKFLTRQVDIDKILHIIQRKVLKNTHLSIEIKEIKAGYLHSPYFKDLYQHLLQNKLPHSKLAIKKLEALGERYVLLDSLLFKINPEKETAVLAIPEECVDKIITLYHKSSICVTSKSNKNIFNN